jgi:hypothetical protein
MEFEPTIAAFEREKTFHALDRAATVIGTKCITVQIFSIQVLFPLSLYLS